MKLSHYLPAFLVLGSLLALPNTSQAQILWDFNNTADPAPTGWTTLNGITTTDGSGVGAGNPGFAHDGNHVTWVMESPEFTFNGTDTLTGGNAFRVGTQGGAGNQSSSPDFANLAAVLAYNGGNANSGGQKGAALLNTTTGNYDYVAYDPGNGGPNPDFGGTNSATFAGAGVNTTDGYKVHIFDTDTGSWGWTRFGDVQIDGTLGGPPPVAVPEPASIAIWSIIGLALSGFGLFRARQKK